ncbi:MAG: tRNA (adenosine(37)-N6)-dimethylallyltransferase MiaA [Clostridia bacterium]|nr:tRNA (adenosine(37)-N6)-dimethylallyltransferase MiaA [Clostridia bacterium]MBQ6893674.1 tRNA (adenosine(37)-N6)-dimethylallyltransferase MiaA [Clostridia bacterium]
MDKIEKSIAIVGSTASGKSALALAAAKALGGEIISVDSMQVYRGMDIGTAKPTKEEMLDIRHHMIDICDPHEPFSAADFATMALECARDISARGRLPIFCGGTGLYLESMMRGGAPAETAADEAVRAELFAFAEKEGAHALHERLREVDPESADAIHENNVKRVARALEIYIASGRKKSDWDRESLDAPKAVEPVTVCLAYHNREILYERIGRRVDIMLEDGLLDETKRLLCDGVFEKNSTAAAAIGYKELIPAIKGEIPLEEAAEMLKTATRRYAKRQITWFSGKPYIKMLYCDTEGGEMRSFDDIFAEFTKIIGE